MESHAAISTSHQKSSKKDILIDIRIYIAKSKAIPEQKCWKYGII
jgi:hypothetical protein